MFAILPLLHCELDVGYPVLPWSHWFTSLEQSSQLSTGHTGGKVDEWMTSCGREHNAWCNSLHSLLDSL